jgi:hypothetical protein
MKPWQCHFLNCLSYYWGNIIFYERRNFKILPLCLLSWRTASRRGTWSLLNLFPVIVLQGLPLPISFTTWNNNNKNTNFLQVFSNSQLFL